jgi:uncharacterized protein (TIGR02594 family)
MEVPKGLEKIPWLNAGYKELVAGVGRFGAVDSHGKATAAHDVEGHVLNNPRILEYFAATEKKKGGWAETNSWCSAFVNWCMHQAGIHGTGSAMARSWLHWHQGEQLSQPRAGAVVIFPRPPKPESGHVALVWRVDGNQLDVLGGNQSAHHADPAHHKAGISSHVSIAHRRTDTALGFMWPKTVPVPLVSSPTVSNGAASNTMLILRGLAGHYVGRDWPRGAMFEAPAIEYARRMNYNGRVLDVAGSRRGAHSEQTLMALEEIRRDQSITALYGFSAGGYSIFHIVHALTPAERKRLRLVVVLGAPLPRGASEYQGSWELVYRTDPPAGHMYGPQVLLDSLL